MSKFLKGNYEVEQADVEESRKQEKTFTEIFENRTLEALGGSIAFVMKSSNLIWNGEDEKAD